ncbi:MAG: ATP-dependent helicase [Anaerolineae bacterium]|nr:ATP-dependent helicase [Anaerolineae bacterium]
MNPLNLRPQQAHIVNTYAGGRLAVSAVPGSGKTQTLAALAAHLLARGMVGPDAEILVVTFTNSAVENIKARIRLALRDLGLGDDGFRVLTLHGLANAVVRERPDLAGVASDYHIDDELSSGRALSDAARWFTQQERDYWLSFLPSDLTQQQRYQLESEWFDETVRVAAEVTKLAKHLRLRPAEVRALILGAGDAGREGISPFLRIGAVIYERYDRVLRAGSRLDFDDLIWAAIRALNNDDDFCRRLGRRWPFILEDEAQDSTPLQEEILALLSREHGNWVRVGDPNQAIMTTFTASDVRFFRAFKQRSDVRAMPLTVSGRSAPEIIALANRLVDWTTRAHPEPDVRRQALSADGIIQPTPPGDPQPNPVAGRIRLQAFDSEDAEAQKVAQSAVRFVLSAPDKTCAILSPTHAFGHRILRALAEIQARHPQRALYQDQLRNAQPVRNVARVLAQAVRLCGQPTNTNALVELRSAMAEAGIGSSGDARDNRVKALLRSARPERLLFPLPDAAPPLPAGLTLREDEAREVYALAALAAHWLRASVLPVDQLILAIAQQLFTQENDLAIAHSLAASLRRYMMLHPDALLADAARELDAIAANRQRYLSSSLIEAGFRPAAGQITLTTMHKAKGLEWDRVYLTCVDEVEFPHDASGEFRGQVWYLAGHDPALEARVQLEALAGGASGWTEADLLRRARLEYIAERLRLLYVGITRARSDLFISYSRRRMERDNRLALAMREVLRDGSLARSAGWLEQTKPDTTNGADV